MLSSFRKYMRQFCKPKRRVQVIACRIKWRSLATKNRIKALRRRKVNLNYVKDMKKPLLKYFTKQNEETPRKKTENFPLDKKLLALSAFKLNKSGYIYASKLYHLPSCSSLKILMGKIPFLCGINQHLFLRLKQVVHKMTNLEKHCVLMFGSIPLQPHIGYNSCGDFIEGFVDFGGEDRRKEFADRALVFMVKGIRKTWKQPVCYVLHDRNIKTKDFTKTIKEVVKNVRKIGLKIIASVSDQKKSNVAAIKSLQQENGTYYQGYVIDGEEIIHLYDCPHLLKAVRNDMLTKNLHFKQDGVYKVASWSNIVKLYHLDQLNGQFKMLNKLSPEHVLPSKIKKKKVVNCVQALSQRVASFLHFTVKHSVKEDLQSEYYFDPSAQETAELVLFFNNLFDSVNGTLMNPPFYCKLKGVVTPKTRHVLAWNNSISVLESMYFTSPDSSEKVVSRAFENWVFTLQGFRTIWKNMRGFRFFSPRAFNLDPLENLFSHVRSLEKRKKKPTCASFISSVKYLTVSKSLLKHYSDFDCEKDESCGLLDDFKSFIEG